MKKHSHSNFSNPLVPSSISRNNLYVIHEPVIFLYFKLYFYVLFVSKTTEKIKVSSYVQFLCNERCVSRIQLHFATRYVPRNQKSSVSSISSTSSIIERIVSLVLASDLEEEEEVVSKTGNKLDLDCNCDSKLLGIFLQEERPFQQEFDVI